MLYSLSTIPVKNKKKAGKNFFASLEDRVTGWIILCTWCFLLFFSLLSLWEPVWFVKISDPGRETEAQRYKQRGDYSLKLGNFPLAVIQYTRALEIQPDLLEARGNLGIIYSQTGNFNKAISIYRKLIADKPEQAYVSYLHLAEIYEKQQDYQNAIKYYRLSAETAPFPSHPYTKLGTILAMTEDWEKAIDALQLAIIHRTDFTGYYLGMLKRDVHLLKKDTGLTKAIQKELEKGITPADLEKYDIRIFQERLKYDREYAIMHGNLGWCYDRLGNPQSALV
ncbi:MAG: tetratricopeptide repeat protein, partial [Candidatus Cloacimonetes bacterium]|nr:tetratricopeptide repeat protein [Candidatus Cloacimonadota bacterium]